MKRSAAVPVLLLTAFTIFAGDSRLTVQFGPSGISWNPHYAYTTTEAQVFTALYEGLTVLNPATLNPEPGAAESWDISGDGLKMTFRLRENLVWSNGRKLGAEDFKDSWLTLLSPERGAQYGSLLDDVKGAQAFRQGNAPAEDVALTAVDSRTLEVEFRRPSPQFLAVISHYSFSPVYSEFRDVEDWSAIRSVPVNGPYIIRARSSREVLLDKNPEYWDADSVTVEGLRLLFHSDSDETMDLFNRGELEWVASGIDASLLAAPETLVIAPAFSTTYYYFSNRKAPWKDARVRRALALLVPWEEIRGECFIPAEALVPPIPDYPEVSALFPPENLREEEALTLLENAGFPNGKGLPSPVILVPEGDTTARAMKEAWENLLGLETIVRETEPTGYYSVVTQVDYDIAMLTWTGDYADPLTFLKMWESGSSFNESGFSLPDYDDLLHEAALLSYEERLVKLAEAEAILLQTCQVMPQEHLPGINLIDRRFIDGWYPNALDIHPFKYLVPRNGFDIPGVVRRF